MSEHRKLDPTTSMDVIDGAYKAMIREVGMSTWPLIHF